LGGYVNADDRRVQYAITSPDPPRVFVAEGPYQFVRNPMISGLMFVLWGEACILRSAVHAEWAGIFMLVKVIYIPLLEEPMLVSRFGSPYIRYRRAVKPFIPRLHAWRSDTRDETSGAGAEALRRRGGCCLSMSLRDSGRLALFMDGGARVHVRSMVPDDWLATADPTFGELV
jgi:hypothetical protein